jgi:hypothetical protein
MSNGSNMIADVGWVEVLQAALAMTCSPWLPADLVAMMPMS